jgi:RNA polymerase sigma-70 factor (ECF subfamily)
MHKMGRMDALESRLVDSMDELLAYVRSKVNDDEIAADVLQTSLLKALRAAPALRDEDRLFPWFYHIMNNTIADIYRRRKRERTYLERYAHEVESIMPPTEPAAICRCFVPLLPALKPEYAEVLQALDLDEEDSALVADRLGISRNNLKVRHHRARQQLRHRLELTCNVCSEHGCLDCSCKLE